MSAVDEVPSLAKRLLLPAAVLLPLACSSATGERGGEDALIVPEDLRVTALAGGTGVLELIALTLRAGASGTAVYAALRNGGDVPACSAAFSIELFDAAEQSLAAGIGGLLTQRFYQLTDGSGEVAACVGPGDVSMASVTDLPSDLTVEEVAAIVYRCPYFALDVRPIAGITVTGVKSETDGAGSVYTGVFRNGLDVAVERPSVSVFATNRAGRPLDLAIASAAIAVPPGGTWSFETSSVDASASDYAAYPAGALADRP